METSEKALPLLHHIGAELKLLWAQMDVYQELFLVEQEKRGALLHATAPGFFTITQMSLAESILMRIFRLMDPPQSCGDENSSIQHLHDVLREDDRAEKPLMDCIEQIRKDWANKGTDEDQLYAPLRIIRNKWLAHNDFTERSALEENQLGMNLSLEAFESAQRLAGRLWALYQQSSRVLLGADVLEPRHATLEQRPSRLLWHLCASRYLDVLIGDEEKQHIVNLDERDKLVANEMGDDVIRSVFAQKG